MRPLRGEGGVNPTPEEPEEGANMAGEGDRERRVGDGEYGEGLEVCIARLSLNCL